MLEKHHLEEWFSKLILHDSVVLDHTKWYRNIPIPACVLLGLARDFKSGSWVSSKLSSLYFAERPLAVGGAFSLYHA